MVLALEEPSSPPSTRELFEEDDEFLERDVHGDMARICLIEPLRTHFGRSGIRAFVGGNSAIFYDTWQNPISPDVYVVPGGEWRGQNSWAVHEEGDLFPSFVMEMLSPKTARRDRNAKMKIYRDIFKARDFFMLDLKYRLEGYHLVNGVYQPVRPDARGRLKCSSLDFSMAMVDGYPRWFDSSGNLLLTGREEAAQAYEQIARANEQTSQACERAARAQEREARAQEREARAQEQAAQDRERAHLAEAELARLRAEVEKLRGL